MTKEEILRDIDKTCIQLMLKEPFYGHFFTNLIKDVVTGDHPVQTAAISLNPSTNTLSLLVNDKFWMEELKGSNPEEGKNLKYGIIKHEILHILFKHIFNYHKFTDKTIANIAVDLVVNQFILLEQLPMQDKICLLQNFPDFFPNVNFDGSGNVTGGDDSNKTSEYYYRILMKQAEEIGQKLSSSFQQQSDQNQSGQGQPQSGQGNQQNGNDQNDKDDSNDGQNDSDDNGEGEDEKEGQGSGGMESNPNWNKLNPSQKNLAKFLGNKQNQQMHSTWKELSEMNKGKKDFVENWVDSQIEGSIKRADRGDKSWRGKLPGGLLDYLEKLIDSLKPSANWKKVLREFAQNGERTYHEPTLKRKSKRYGTFPGHKIVTESKLLVALDTSGSVCNESLAEFFAEINNIYKTGSDIRIVECDYSIGKIWDYQGKPPESITGRGGTSFDEPIIYANEEYKPDAVIYFTDGEAPKPKDKCNCPIIWIISKNQGVSVDQIEDFPGIKIKMDF